MQDLIALLAEPLRGLVGDNLLVDGRIVASLVPAPVAGVAEDDHVPCRPVAAETVFAESQGFTAAVDFAFNFWVSYGGVRFCELDMRFLLGGFGGCCEANGGVRGGMGGRRGGCWEECDRFLGLSP